MPNPTSRSSGKSGSSAAKAELTARVAPYEKLKQAILEGELEPGQALVEVALAEWCGVSRTPVREALSRLEQDGLVYRDLHGLSVRQRSPEEILDLYDTRAVLECAAGRTAAERRTDHDLRVLRWSVSACDGAADADTDTKVEVNQRFHSAVWRASHNEALSDLLERIFLHLARYPGSTLSVPGRWETAVSEHAQIVDAIEQRDGDAAAEITAVHFAAARDIRLDLFAGESATRTY